MENKTNKTSKTTLSLAIALGLLSSASFAAPASIPTALVGSWVYSQGSSTTYVNTATGATSDPGGIALYYQFNADGTYGYAYRESVTNYNCTTTFTVYKAGRLQVNGNKLVLQPTQGQATYIATCSPSLNSDRALRSDELRDDPYTWSLAKDNGGLVLTTPSGATGTLRPWK
ncbi:hypothetical protein [Deinococcus yavapaiensis]|uniref:Uncharacterized protein n=1 Tax=Deinococcus yavapaiensis KR-236 TaxID=694435 RepID=A0A318S6V8_9DEIO|nr:hypothetical protein [Deinococcus yavapaiensis]PYE50471.1 hypothetical protein DES52_11888 [Deinococcus yavapaiensis KR-236]